MTILYQFRPWTTWPGPQPRSRQRGPFRAAYSDTLRLLEKELRHLAAKNIVVQAAVDERDIRQDGMLRSDARPKRPGIILSFDSKHGPLSYPCDTYSAWEDNLRAIALALEALRAVDRYGVTRRAEQYRGWQQLPPPESRNPSASDATLVLAQILGRPVEAYATIDAAIRDAELRTHPDRGGNPELFKRVQWARAILLKG
jgi:hypothetical protein